MTPQNKIKSEFIFNEEQLHLIASLTIGDGCIYKGGRFLVRHGIKQTDYNNWKAEQLSKCFSVEIKALPTNKCTQIQFQRRSLKNFYYKVYNTEGKKIISELLRFSLNPAETAAIWIMDDGNCCPSLNSKTGKCYSSHLQIFTFTDLEETVLLADWFEKHFKLRPKLIFKDRSKSNRLSAYILKFSAEDSRKLYPLIKPYIPKIPSMIYKFRYIEYNLSKSPQREEILEKIV